MDDGGQIGWPPSKKEVSMAADHRVTSRKIVVILTIKIKIILIRK